MTRDDTNKRINRILTNHERGLVGQSEAENQIALELVWIKSDLTWAAQTAHKIVADEIKVEDVRSGCSCLRCTNGLDGCNYK